LEFGELNEQERIRRYKRYVYEAGSLDRKEQKPVATINDKIINKEREKNFKVNKIDRFLYRTRYFSDSGIIGSKEFVFQSYLKFKNLFKSKKKKKPVKITGLDSIYSLKRLIKT